MEFVVITGLSGAGKTLAMHAMEDIGFYCVDNLPPDLIYTFCDLCKRSEDDSMNRVAVVVDTRGGTFEKLFSALSKLHEAGIMYKILYLDADKEVLASRFKQTRRKHPLADRYSGSVTEAINVEQKMLEKLKAIADYIVDTSKISPMQLKERVSEIFLGDNLAGMSVTCMSFGFKYGMPTESDLVFDVRCLPNPFYVTELKHKTGNDEEVFNFVMDSENSKELLKKIISYLEFTLPLYADEGKSQLVISVGCSGGKHRSVTFAREIYRYLQDKGQKVSIYHRDIGKE